MKIVIDTNVLISAVFFGGNPRKIIEAVADDDFHAFATPAIIEEYCEIVDEIVKRKQGRLNQRILSPLIEKLSVIETVSTIKISRDPDDDKFIECAIDAGAIYIISGDKDLLDIGEYQNVQIITAQEFCQKYLCGQEG